MDSEITRPESRMEVIPPKGREIAEQIEGQATAPRAEFIRLESELQDLKHGRDERVALLLEKLEALEYAYFVDGKHLPDALARFENSLETLSAEIELMQKQIARERAKVEPAVKLRESQIKVLGILQKILKGGGINNRDLDNVHAAFEAEQALQTPGLSLSPESVLGALERNINVPRYQRILELASSLVNAVKPEVEEIIKMRQADKSPEDQLWGAKKERAEILRDIEGVDTDPPKNSDETDQEYAYRIITLHRQRNEYVRAYEQLTGKIARLEAEVYKDSGVGADDTVTRRVARRIAKPVDRSKTVPVNRTVDRK